jgi:Arc/MetJ-type ribon-helix-helix transcriptional regulator
MTITLSREIEERISAKMRDGGFASPDAIVEEAIAMYLDEGLSDEGEADFPEIRQAVNEGLAQGIRGEAMPLSEFEERMRAKYGVHR